MTARTDALIATLTQPRARTVATTGVCRAKAPCGAGCCLDASVRHTLHVCKDEGCICHSRERYEREKGARQVHGRDIQTQKPV